MKEYELLRAEMMQYYSEINSTQNILYTSVAAILAFSFNISAETPTSPAPPFCFLLFLLPYMVVVPLFLACERKHKNVCKLGTYLCVFLEGNEFKWESRHYVCDDIPKNRKRDWKSYFMYYTNLFVCSFISFLKLMEDSRLTWEIKVICTLLIIALFVFSYVFMKTNTFNYVVERNKMIKEWKRIKELEQSKTENISPASRNWHFDSSLNRYITY